MNKAELVKAIATKTGYTQVAVAEVLEEFMAEVKGTVKKGNSVQLIGFGTFSSTKRKARKGTTPQGKAFKSAAKTVARFKPSSKFLKK